MSTRYAAARLWADLCAHFFAEEHPDLEYGEFCEMGEALGLLRRERYAPKRHGALDAEPGDLIYVQTTAGRRLLGPSPTKAKDDIRTRLRGSR